MTCVADATTTASSPSRRWDNGSTTRTTNSSLLPKRRNNVSFEEKLRIHSVPSLNDFTKEECDAAWFSCYDMDDFKERERKLRDMSSSSAKLHRKELGMDTQLERKLRYARIDVGLYSVLLEQQRQILENNSRPEKQVKSVCPESLANILRSTSMESMSVALDKARDVAKQVQRDNSEEGEGYDESSSARKNKIRRNSKSTSALSSRRKSRSRSRTSSSSSSSNWLLPTVKEDENNNHKNKKNSNAKWKVVNSNTTNTSSFNKLSIPTTANMKWQVNCDVASSKLTQPKKKKYDLSKLAGLVGVPVPSKSSKVKPVQ